ncbi:hypothetical protein [Devosia submarina]|uniref:hypothetical protein n=1 Tax=Devosia submarina TaxID=1173082 RepID=UPI000D380F93|nr:hypothetical protein [Devosia submarina]
MSADEIKVYIAIAASVVSILVAVGGFLKLRSAMAVTEAPQKKRVDDLEQDVKDLHTELGGVKTGLEAGISKVQDSLASLTHALGEVKTKVKILFDRDGRDEARAAAAQTFAAKRPGRPRKPVP